MEFPSDSIDQQNLSIYPIHTKKCQSIVSFFRSARRSVWSFRSGHLREQVNLLLSSAPAPLGPALLLSPRPHHLPAVFFCLSLALGVSRSAPPRLYEERLLPSLRVLRPPQRPYSLRASSPRLLPMCPPARPICSTAPRRCRPYKCCNAWPRRRPVWSRAPPHLLVSMVPPRAAKNRGAVLSQRGLSVLRMCMSTVLRAALLRRPLRCAACDHSARRARVAAPTPFLRRRCSFLPSSCKLRWNKTLVPLRDRRSRCRPRSGTRVLSQSSTARTPP